MKKIGVVFLLTIWACGNPDDPQQAQDFDRTAFLNNYANEFIVPGFAELSLAVDQLDGAVQACNTIADLRNQEDRWYSAYKTFIAVSAFNIGPAAEAVLKKSFQEEVGTFPVSQARVGNKLRSGNLGVNDFERDSRGFLTLEYLIFDSAVQSESNALAYAKAVSAHLKSSTDAVNTGWNTYRTTFVSNDGTSAGSSTSELYNEFVKSFEALKNFKIGLPLGLRPGQTAAVPQNVESFYGGMSRDFAKAHFEMVKKLWLGSNNLGFKDYLMTVEGGKQLVNSTETQLRAVELAFEGVSNNDFLPASIDQNTALINLHTELQKLTRYFKSEMSSVLGIAITFNSGDGD